MSRYARKRQPSLRATSTTPGQMIGQCNALFGRISTAPTPENDNALMIEGVWGWG